VTPDPVGFLFSKGCARWPTLQLSEQDFRAYVEPLVRLTPPEGRAKLHAEDLFLSLACALSVPGAAMHCEKTYFSQLAQAVAGIDPSVDFVDEALQELRQKLFIGEPAGQPKILMYAGRGPLGGWLRMAAIRAALDLQRRQRTHQPLDETIPPDFALAQDLELDTLKAEQRQHFRSAFQLAFGELSQRDRNVLRLQWVDGLNIDEIGRLYHVHRATVARWIAAARELLLGGTRRALCARLKLSSSEVDQLFELIQSQLDVSLERLLVSKGA
jgi:RNA polymerase sigma-70 factor (ECF subfamily)